MRQQFIYALITSMVIFFSCEKDSDIKLPEDDPKLAVYGFLSPEDSITSIMVKETVPYFGNNRSEIRTITNAQVIIVNKGVEYILPYNTQMNSYCADSSTLKITPGEEYFLEVSSPEFPSVNASLAIHLNKNSTMEYINYRRSSEYGEIYLNVKWNDNASEKNYYRLTGFKEEYITYSTATGDTTIIEYQILDSEGYLLYEDSDWNGLTKSSNDLYFTSYSDTGTIHMILLDVDYHYYQYHKSVRDFDKSEENPFSEPILVYSNIQNGSGVFASYRKYKIVENIEFTF